MYLMLGIHKPPNFILKYLRTFRLSTYFFFKKKLYLFLIGRCLFYNIVLAYAIHQQESIQEYRYVSSVLNLPPPPTPIPSL